MSPRLPFLAAIVLLTACVGAVGEGREQAPGAVADPPATVRPPAGGGVPDPPATNPVAMADPPATPTAPVASPLLRLTAREHRNTTRDAFAGIALPAYDLPPDDGLVTDAHVAAYLDAAELIADAVAAKPGALAAGCDATGYERCLPALLARVVPRLWRRPPTPAESQRLLDSVYRPVAAKHGATVALSQVLQHLLASPELLYKVERGTTADAVAPLTGHELAARLSYFLWQRPPDDRLLAVADRLRERPVVEAEARRMLADPRAAEATWHFIHHWLQLERFESAAKDPVRFPSFSGARASMRKEARAFVDEVFAKHGGSLRALLLGEFTYVNDQLAALYGMPAPGATEPVRVSLAGGPRAGLLTTGAWLAGHANMVAPSVVFRGLTIREELLCDRPPPPPPGAEGEEISDRLAASQCAGCHRLLDPIGMAFDAFDAVGRHVPAAVARGAVHGTLDADGEYGGHRPLLEALARSRQVAECASRQLVKTALGRAPGGGDETALSRMQHAIGASDGGLVAAMVELATSDSFARRRIEPVSCQ